MKDVRAPIAEFVRQYGESGTVRMHMPGHKGVPLLGAEAYDITEIRGADYLYEPAGIILRSSEIAAELYGSRRTLFSTEGSSLSIKAMLTCAAASLGRGAKFASARNCHRAFINGCILLGIDPVWIYPEKPAASICSSEITAHDVEQTLAADPDIRAVYITSPDYPGNLADIRGIAQVCHARGALLLVDNAHGAYLKFAGQLHPLDLGADMCCDSAHKTLPALTGASLLHISKSAPAQIAEIAPEEMSLFASTSPSYVIMQSIERCMAELQSGLAERIALLCQRLSELKQEIRALGLDTAGDEPMKLTLSPAGAGYTGDGLAEHLRSHGIEPEYSDGAYCVLMPTPCNTEDDLIRVLDALKALPKRTPITDPLPELIRPRKALAPREAYFLPHERIPLSEADGRICARTAVSCQPSVPVIVGGEVFDKKIIKILERYSFFQADVVK
ncbi:MAG: aminotransferase class V-fold PLP-dependent enzyme [Ruminococcus sp.]|nr:aminotransferase class V-fold PLP-dependent enzyme [Ruminococcus sp.]